MVSANTPKIRYAVIGLGWIAQDSVLPAFKHARKNCELTALVSDSPTKLKKLSKKYNVPYCYSYEQYEDCLNSGLIDAVYIALPNHLHYEYTIKAARAGIHVLCEKPMAMTEEECREMIEVCRQHRVKLMIAYRLHFEEGNLKAVQMANNGKLGDTRFFNSTFSMPVTDPSNVRLDQTAGGGTLYDIGIYCINASRSIFKSEPEEVVAVTTKGGKKKFREVDEMTSATLRFPKNRFATFISSFGAAPSGSYDVIGTRGHLRVDPAYEHKGSIKHTLWINENEKQRTFAHRDQFAPELVYFSDCILNDKEPEPSGLEGLADVRIIEGLYRSAKEKRPIHLKTLAKPKRPSVQQEIRRPKSSKPRLVAAKAPH